jgi:hypothetical protein
MYFSIKTILAATLSLNPVSQAYLTQNRPVTLSSLRHCLTSGPTCTDGVFDTTNDCSAYAHTNEELNPWININLVQSSTIASVFLLSQ